MSTHQVINFANQSGMHVIGFHLQCETPTGKPATRHLPAFWFEFRDASFRSSSYLRHRFSDVLKDFHAEASKYVKKLAAQGYKNFQVQVGCLSPHSDKGDVRVPLETPDDQILSLAVKAYHHYNDRMVNSHAQRHFKRDAFHDLPDYSESYAHRIKATAEEIQAAREEGERVCSLMHPDHNYRLLNNRLFQWSPEWLYVGAVDLPLMHKTWDCTSYDKFLAEMQLEGRYPRKGILLGYQPSRDLKQVHLAMPA